MAMGMKIHKIPEELVNDVKKFGKFSDVVIGMVLLWFERFKHKKVIKKHNFDPLFIYHCFHLKKWDFNCTYGPMTEMFRRDIRDWLRHKLITYMQNHGIPAAHTIWHQKREYEGGEAWRWPDKIMRRKFPEFYVAERTKVPYDVTELRKRK